MFRDVPHDLSLMSSADPRSDKQDPWAETDSPAANPRGSVILMPGRGRRASGFDVNQSKLAVFNQAWWVGIARGSSYYRELRIVDGDAVLGRLPYILSSNMGLFQAQDPHWSHLGGPTIDERLSREEQSEVVHRLLKHLPRWCSGYFVCNPHKSYADLVRDAFKKAGFEHTVQTTYVRHPSDAGVMHTRKSKHFGHIKRASQKLDCVDISGTEFVRFFDENLKARGKTSYAPLDIVTDLTNEAVRRGQGRAIAAQAKDSREKPGGGALYDAAVVYVWDHSHCYYWMSTYRPGDGSSPKPHPDAIKLLAMRAMQHAQDMNLIFDADGVTTPGSDHLYRNMFGLRKEECRDVFQRTAGFERLVRRITGRSKRWMPHP